MSKEHDVKAAASLSRSGNAADEECWLQINVRLRLDEIVQAESDGLAANKIRDPTPRELVTLAGRIYEARRTRERVFGGRLFGEPAWDMLLALYYLPKDGQLLSVSSLSYAANIPATTGLRWQSILTEHGLIERGPSGIDCRMKFVRLTSLGRQLLERYLKRLHEPAAPTDPFLRQSL